jgi:adenylate cyclase
LTPEQDVECVSSKEVLARTGISRATLNNYIAVGLIPRPTVRKPDYAKGPTKIGYFPRWVLDRLAKVQELKSAGMRIPDIATYLQRQKVESLPMAESLSRQGTHLSIHDLSFPAVFVNHHWEVMWLNDYAEQMLFKKGVRDIVCAPERNLLRLLLVGDLSKTVINWKDIVLAHVRLAKRKLNDAAIQEICRETPLECGETLNLPGLGAKPPVTGRSLIEQKLVLRSTTNKALPYTLVAGEFREGILLLYYPAEVELEEILDLVSDRAKLVRSLLAEPIPALTSLSILAARLESDLHLTTVLPAREYFDLITQITRNSQQCIQDHRGVVGIPFHEGIVGFFLSVPTSPAHHLDRTLQCAQALHGEMTAIDQHWKRKKGWSNSLRLSLGLHSGQECAGNVPSPAGFDYRVIGESVPEAIKLATFARGGTIWASKRFIESLRPDQGRRIVFGIERDFHGARSVDSGIYSRVCELMDLDTLQRRALHEIENLAVAQIFSLDLPAEKTGKRDEH